MNINEISPEWLNFIQKEFNLSQNLTIIPINRGGSTRKFFRIRQNDKTLILCYDEDDAQFSAYLEIGRFLQSYNIPVPEIISYQKHLALLKDVGDTTLQELYYKGEAHQFYLKILEILVYFQILDAKDCHYLNNRIFGIEDYLWETSYFRDNFFKRLLGIDLSGDEKLTEEFKVLAQKLKYEPLYNMHRDFQSQNIFIKEKSLYILDFQGARKGPLQYDLASLIKDPYVKMPPNLQQELLDYYKKAAKSAGITFKDSFEETYLLICLQRLMQAVGAYCFLTLVKGKTKFFKYISPALILLKETLDEVSGFKYLKSILDYGIDVFEGKSYYF